MFPRGFQSLTLLWLFLLLDHCSPSITSHISDLLPVKNLHFFNPGFFYHLRLSFLRLHKFDQHISLWFIIWAIFIFSNCQNYRNLSFNTQMFPKRVEKGQITATSIHQQSLLTSRICKHALCSNLGLPSRREPRSRKTSRFWKHVQWGSGVAARPHIATVIWTAT